MAFQTQFHKTKFYKKTAVVIGFLLLVTSGTGISSDAKPVELNIKKTPESLNAQSKQNQNQLKVAYKPYKNNTDHAIYTPRKYTDINNHWGQSLIKELSGYGFFDKIGSDSTKHTLFNPKSPVKKIEAAKMLVIATKLNPYLEKQQELHVEVRLPKSPNNLYKVTLQIEGPKGKLVQIIMKDYLIPGGKVLNAYWDKRREDGGVVLDGNYQVKAIVTEKGKVVATHTESITLTQRQFPIVDFQNKSDKRIKDIPQKGAHMKWALESMATGILPMGEFKEIKRMREEVINVLPIAQDQAIYKMTLVDGTGKVQKTIHLNNQKNLSQAALYKIVEETEKASYFRPDELLTRSKFLAAIGNSLYHLGAEDNENLKLDEYIDTDKIDLADQKGLNIYFSEFGHLKTPYPNKAANKPISKDEAAWALYQLVYWKNPNAAAYNALSTNTLSPKSLQKTSKKTVKATKATAKSTPKKSKKIKKSKPVKQVEVRTVRNPRHPYKLIAGVHQRVQTAVKEAKKIKNQGQDAFVWKHPNNSYYYIQVGAYKKLVQAKQFQDRLKHRQIDTYIKVIN